MEEEQRLEETGVELLAEEEDLVNVSVTGRLDTVGTGRIDTQFTAMVAPRGKHALVDISGVTFLASMGIRLLVGVARTLARHQKQIVLYAPQPLVRESIENTGLKDMLQMVDSEQEARAHLNVNV
jgi:anti-sigma B factor antagonist